MAATGRSNGEQLVPRQALDVADRATCYCREAEDEHERDEQRVQFWWPVRQCEGGSYREEDDHGADDEQIAPASLIDCVPRALIGER